ncbi:ARM repeat-containing protein [Auriculariales sp. MPI-PUGE-AT-0066]|nr:ARM repeat-containing protein [Auriculariales sp. MPI-PUGE-AT-0066]
MTLFCLQLVCYLHVSLSPTSRCLNPAIDFASHCAHHSTTPPALSFGTAPATLFVLANHCLLVESLSSSLRRCQLPTLLHATNQRLALSIRLPSVFQTLQLAHRTGVRIRARKGAVKAQAKHEPTVFRDQLLKHVASAPPGDYGDMYERLVQAGVTLEMLKYADEMFDVLINRCVVYTAGGTSEDGAPISRFALVLQPGDKEVREGVEAINKLSRRYKYLQKPLEERALPKLFQYGHKWPADQRDKLCCHATGLMIAMGLVTPAALKMMTKEHLIKDGGSSRTLVFLSHSYVSLQTMDQLATALRKGGVRDLVPFFVPSKRTPAAMQDWFKDKGVPAVAEWWAKRQSVAARELLIATVKEHAEAEEGTDAIVAAIKAWQTAHPGALVEPADALVSAVWQALMSSVDWASARPDQIDALALREITKYAPVLEPFCSTAKTQVGLINVVQVHCYEDTRLMRRVYNLDCVSDKAIIYWHQKGAKPQGKQHFLKATEALVKFLQEQESEDEDE